MRPTEFHFGKPRVDCSPKRAVGKEQILDAPAYFFFAQEKGRGGWNLRKKIFVLHALPLRRAPGFGKRRARSILTSKPATRYNRPCPLPPSPFCRIPLRSRMMSARRRSPIRPSGGYL